MYIYTGNLTINWNHSTGKVIKFVWEKKSVEFILENKKPVGLTIKYQAPKL